MGQVHVIRHKVLVEGQSVRSVARQLKVSRNTVRRYLRLTEPVRVETRPRPRPVSKAVEPLIDGILQEWGDRVTRKQRVTGSRLHEELLDRGHEVGITTVRACLREKRRRQAEVFVPLVHRLGDEAQVDFFEVTVDLGGVRRKAWMFLMRLMGSGYDFIWIYDRCDQVSFLDGHVRAFAHFGGRPHRIVYDNLTLAVKRRVGVRRELTDRFLALVSHYLFEPCFARRGEGHDKGGVEARGKGVRLQHLTPIPAGESLKEISRLALQRVTRRARRRKDRRGTTIWEKFLQEREKLCRLPEVPFEPRRLVTVSISIRALVRIEGVEYSVPSGWARLPATAYVGPTDIRVVCRGKLVSFPKRRPGERGIQYRHYLGELARKPQAVRQVAPELLAELGAPFDRLWELLVATHEPKNAARILAGILAAVVEHGEQAVREALAQAVSHGRADLLALRRRLDVKTPSLSIVVPEPLASYEVEAGCAADYDWMLKGVMS